MLKASNCVANLQGMDRDAAVSLRKEIQRHAQENFLPNRLPTSADLDRVAEEERVRVATSNINGEQNGI